MNILKKILKYTFILVGGVIGITIIVGILFLNIHPKFGASASDDQLEKYESSPQFDGEQFRMVPMTTSMWRMIKEGFEANPTRPSRIIKAIKMDSLKITQRDQSTTKLTWLGHSAFVLEIDGKVILLDPMLGDNTSPIPFSSADRFSELPLEIDQIPYIDAVVFSHDHYDHLDYKTVKRIKDRVGIFIAPLGLSSHLKRWGVQEDKIVELDWWESIQHEDITFVSAPAQHFSGRGVLDRASTLWCSWVIQGSRDNIYFSGDGGYNTHFTEIGDKYGPFDIAMLECGQYNALWKSIHMYPEETVQAAIDLNAKVFMPIHWGSFQLAYHDWTDPIERVTQQANEQNVPITNPEIGETVVVNSESFPYRDWWGSYR